MWGGTILRQGYWPVYVCRQLSIKKHACLCSLSALDFKFDIYHYWCSRSVWNRKQETKQASAGLPVVPSAPTSSHPYPLLSHLPSPPFSITSITLSLLSAYLPFPYIWSPHPSVSVLLISNPRTAPSPAQPISSSLYPPPATSHRHLHMMFLSFSRLAAVKYQ